MATPFIVVASVPRRTRRLGRGVQLGDADTPAVLDGTQLLAVVPMGDQETVVPLDAGPRQASEPRFRAASFYRVATTGYPVTLQWTRLEAGSGHAHVDLAVAARLRVVDAAAFLQTVARARCGDGVPLSADLIASWLAETMRPRLLEELRRYSLDVLLQKNPLPDRWWQRALEERLSPHGLAVDGVGNVHWSSPDAEAARMAEERRRHLASVETLQQVEREAALARTRMEAAFERKLKELELDTVRQQELEVRQKKELAAVELEWERLRRAAEVEALEHERRLAELRPLYLNETGSVDPESGAPGVGKEIVTRIGLNTAKVSVGNFGSRTRMDYTALGDGMNLAARLEGANKVFRSVLMISRATHDRLDDGFRSRELGRLQVVGRVEPVTVFEPMFAADYAADARRYETYDEGLRLWYNNRLEEARERFASISDSDQPALRMVEQIDGWLARPPEMRKGWNGVVSLTEK